MRFDIVLRGCMAFAAASLVAGSASATLILNPAQSITHRTTVQMIQVADDAGANAATVLGDASQRGEIETLVDSVWAQAGIDIAFLPSVASWDDSFALLGNTSPRPQSDLAQIFADATLEGGILHPDPGVIDLFFVEIVPGFSQENENVVAGLAFLGANGIAAYVGDNLLGFGLGREAIASVISHEIGHNYGLDHLIEAENLMEAAGSPNPGERLNAAQIAAAQASAFAIPMPEPSTFLLVAAGLLALASRRRRS